MKSFYFCMLKFFFLQTENKPILRRHQVSPHRQRDVAIFIQIVYDVTIFFRVVIHHFPSPHRSSPPPDGARQEHERRVWRHREMDPRKRHFVAAGHGFELFAGGFRREQSGSAVLSQVIKYIKIFVRRICSICLQFKLFKIFTEQS